VPVKNPKSAAPARGGLKAHERRTGILLLTPALIAFACVILWPFLQSVGMAFFKYTIEMQAPEYVGLANFTKLMTDQSMLVIWFNTLVFVVLTTGITFLLGLAWALIMNQAFAGRNFLRAISLLPWVLPTTVTAFLAAWIFNGQYGVFNAILIKMGLIQEPVAWLAEETGAMAAVIITKAWLSVPLYMAFFLAGLQGVSQDQVDAARVDGCENVGVLRYVVLPHLAPTMIIVTVLGAMGNLQVFDVIYALTQGGPIRATTVLSIEVYKQAFQNWDLGTASAVGVLWFVTMAIPAGLYLRILFKREQ
jgi:multiple sugar transport system permease protein